MHIILHYNLTKHRRTMSSVTILFLLLLCRVFTRFQLISLECWTIVKLGNFTIVQHSIVIQERGRRTFR